MARVSFLLLIASAAFAGPVWPPVMPQTWRVPVADADDPRQAGLEATVRGEDGTPLYLLKCHTGDYETGMLNYSGLMQCYLFSLVSKDRFRNLLSESPAAVRNWQNRGRFLGNHLLPGCAEYREWGALRHFRLRGFQLTLGITQVDFERKAATKYTVKSYEFDASVTPAADSASALAEPATAPEPPWFYGSGCIPSRR